MGNVWAPISQVLHITMSFVAFSCTMGNWWGNPCISHMTKYAIGWESNGNKAPILREKYEYQFPRLSPYHGFCCIFPYCGKFMEEPMHFPYVEVYHRMGIGWEKSTHIVGKGWLSISQTFAIAWVLLHFPVLWEIYGEPHALPIWWHRLIFSCACDIPMVLVRVNKSKIYAPELIFAEYMFCQIKNSNNFRDCFH